MLYPSTVAECFDLARRCAPAEVGGDAFEDGDPFLEPRTWPVSRSFSVLSSCTLRSPSGSHGASCPLHSSSSIAMLCPDQLLITHPTVEIAMIAMTKPGPGTIVRLPQPPPAPQRGLSISAAELLLERPRYECVSMSARRRSMSRNLLRTSAVRRFRLDRTPCQNFASSGVSYQSVRQRRHPCDQPIGDQRPGEPAGERQQDHRDTDPGTSTPV